MAAALALRMRLARGAGRALSVPRRSTPSAGARRRFGTVGKESTESVAARQAAAQAQAEGAAAEAAAAEAAASQPEGQRQWVFAFLRGVFVGGCATVVLLDKVIHPRGEQPRRNRASNASKPPAAPVSPAPLAASLPPAVQPPAALPTDTEHQSDSAGPGGHGSGA